MKHIYINHAAFLALWKKGTVTTTTANAAQEDELVLVISKGNRAEQEARVPAVAQQPFVILAAQ